MAKRLVIDEIHLTVSVPAGQPDRYYARVRRALTAGGLLVRIRRAVRAVIAADSALAGVRVVVSR